MSNYDKMKADAAHLFLKYDQESMCRKFDLKADRDFIYISFFSRLHRVDRSTGVVTFQDENGMTVDADFNASMVIYDLLCYSKPDCRTSGEIINIKGLNKVQSGTLSGTLIGDNGYLRPYADFFDKNSGRLSSACENIGGIKAERGDVAYTFLMFDFLPITLRFWESEDDIPASLQVFVDKNIIDFMHFETLMYAVSYLLGRVKHIIEI